MSGSTFQFSDGLYLVPFPVTVKLILNKTDTLFITLSLRDIPLVKEDFIFHPHSILTAVDMLFFLTPLNKGGLRGDLKRFKIQKLVNQHLSLI